MQLLPLGTLGHEGHEVGRAGGQSGAAAQLLSVSEQSCPVMSLVPATRNVESISCDRFMG